MSWDMIEALIIILQIMHSALWIRIGFKPRSGFSTLGQCGSNSRGCIVCPIIVKFTAEKMKFFNIKKFNFYPWASKKDVRATGKDSNQGITKKCRLSWLTNRAVHRSPNKLWRFNSIFNLLLQPSKEDIQQYGD